MAEERVQRRLAAILAADVAGYPKWAGFVGPAGVWREGLTAMCQKLTVVPK